MLQTNPTPEKDGPRIGENSKATWRNDGGPLSRNDGGIAKQNDFISSGTGSHLLRFNPRHPNTS